MSTATALAGETMDALIWRVMGNGAGTVEAALELNPAFVDAVILPEGARITLPTPAPARILETLQLWD